MTTFPIENPPPSPRWGPTTKLVVGLSFVTLVAILVIYFRNIIGPLLLAFILAYLLHPLAGRVNDSTRLNWRWSVNLVYLVFVVILGIILTLAGLAILQQIQSLVQIVEQFITNLPQLADELSNRTFTLDPLPFEFRLDQFDLQTLSEQLLATLQPLLGRVGGFLSTFATSFLVSFSWGLFILLISYFLLAESGHVSNDLIVINIPGYTEDLQRIGFELKKIWNAFLRGQLIIFSLVIVLYLILLSGLGVRYALGLALLAGLARFVPYLGPAITWGVMLIVALLQGSNYFNLPAWQFALLAVLLSVILDQILDNVITPRIFGQTLGVHPAAVLVAAIISANLIGIVGLVVAAPVLATLKLFTQYIIRKMFDLDPWPDNDVVLPQIEFPWSRAYQLSKTWLRSLKK